MHTMQYKAGVVMLFVHLHSTAMQIVEWCPERMAESALPTEYTAYMHLKKSPIAAPITYCAAPFNYSVQCFCTHYIPQKLCKGKPAFGIFQGDHCEKIAFAAKQAGVSIMFACAGTGQSYYDVLFLPFPYLVPQRINPAQHKDIWYSFIGSPTHPVRDKVFALPERSDVVIKKRTTFHYAMTDKAKKKACVEEYADVLARSRFALCPRGEAPSSIRFWEALGAGAIPVVIPARNIYLPGCFNWADCIIAIDESDIKNIDQILQSISPEQENKMRERCYQAFAEFSGENLTRCIRSYFEEGPWQAWHAQDICYKPVPRTLIKKQKSARQLLYERLRGIQGTHRSAL